MPRNKNGRQLHRNGPETEDITAALDAIYRDHGCNAELHVYLDLTGRMYVECCADVYVAGMPTLHVSQGRFALNDPYGVMTAMLMTVHATYHEIDRLELRRLAKDT